MECPVCGRKLPRTDGNGCCDRCGSRLGDDERESDLRDRLNEAESLLRAGMTLRALEITQQVVALKPGYPAAHHVMAMVLYAEGRLEEAIRATRYAHSLDPSSGRIDKYLRFLEARYYESNRRHHTTDHKPPQQPGTQQRSAPPIPPNPPRQMPDFTGWVSSSREASSSGGISWGRS